MSSYKYSCPYCGQHIEYTDGYCGQQMACPMCQQRIIFPAIPPGGMSPSLRVARAAEEKPLQKRTFGSHPLFKALREFEHWNVVGQCLVPFLLLGGALVAASALRSKPAIQPVSTPAAAVDPATWEKMTQLARLDQVMQDRVRALNDAYARNQMAEHRRLTLQQQYGSHLDPATVKSAEQQSANTAKALAAARQAFESAMSQYQNLGGTVDYRQQVPR